MRCQVHVGVCKIKCLNILLLHSQFFLLDTALELGIYVWQTGADHWNVFQDFKRQWFQSSKTIARNYTACKGGTYSHIFEIVIFTADLV